MKTTKQFEVQYHTPEFGWICTKKLPVGTSSIVLAENTLKAAVKKNPRKKYRIVEIVVIKKVEPKMPPITIDEHIHNTAKRIFNRIVTA